MCVFAKKKRRIAFPSDSRIGQVLAADEANTRISPELIAVFAPWALDAFEATANLFRLLFRKVGSWVVEDAEDVKLREIAASLGLTDQQLIARLSSAPDPDLAAAQESSSRLGMYRVVKMLVMSCQRYWTWAATDLARLRITPALGYVRLEAETVALVKLFLDEPTLADRWLQIRTPKDGRRFFSETQPRLKTVLESFQLGQAYNIASGGSQHVRMVSLVRAIVSRGGELRLPDQDFDPEDPFSFHLVVAYFHRIQNRVLAALGAILPGVPDDEWKNAIREYSGRVDALWDVIEAQYADRIGELEPEP